MVTRTQILNAIADSTSVKVEELKSRSRIEIVSCARQLYFNCARYLTKESYGFIGEICGRSHGAVLHGVSKVDELWQSNDQMLSFMIENVDKKYPEIVKHLKK